MDDIGFLKALTPIRRSQYEEAQSKATKRCDDHDKQSSSYWDDIAEGVERSLYSGSRTHQQEEFGIGWQKHKCRSCAKPQLLKKRLTLRHYRHIRYVHKLSFFQALRAVLFLRHSIL